LFWKTKDESPSPGVAWTILVGDASFSSSARISFCIAGKMGVKNVMAPIWRPSAEICCNAHAAATSAIPPARATSAIPGLAVVPYANTFVDPARIKLIQEVHRSWERRLHCNALLSRKPLPGQKQFRPEHDYPAPLTCPGNREAFHRSAISSSVLQLPHYSCTCAETQEDVHREWLR